MNIKLVRATVQDVDDYIRIGKRTMSKFNCVAVNPSDVASEIETSIVYMLDFDGQKVGFISYIQYAADHAYIAEVQVDPDFQGRGIGGFALASVLRDLTVVRTIDLHTHPENPAQHLYRRHGFCSTGEIVEDYCGTGEPRMRMVLERP